MECWECGGAHRRSECAVFTEKLRQKGKAGKAGGKNNGQYSNGFQNQASNKGGWGNYPSQAGFNGKGWANHGQANHMGSDSSNQMWPPGLQIPMPGPPPAAAWGPSSTTTNASQNQPMQGYGFCLISTRLFCPVRGLRMCISAFQFSARFA